MATPRKCVIEFQAFRGIGGNFVIKELIIFDIDFNITHSFLFKPPYKFSNLDGKNLKTNKWLSKNYHYILWNEGFIPYCELDNIMNLFTDRYDMIYSKGSEKANWIRTFTKKTVIECSFKSCDLLNTNVCIFVRDPRHCENNCALRNALILQKVIRDDALESPT